MATRAKGDDTDWKQFQSTPPSRVATTAVNYVNDNTAISIHTTLAGGDEFREDLFREVGISIHTTLAGGDVSGITGNVDVNISIHTTLAGGDFI